MFHEEEENVLFFAGFLVPAALGLASALYNMASLWHVLHMLGKFITCLLLTKKVALSVHFVLNIDSENYEKSYDIQLSE